MTANVDVATQKPYCRLSEEEISLEEVVEAVSGPAFPGQGGVTTFIGIVRDHNQGKQVVRLEYEAYPKLVLSTLTSIIEGIERDIKGSRVAIVHRSGVLLVGEAAVVVAASAPHRAKAFEACEPARVRGSRIEDVPIWKKEVSPDGEKWIGMRPEGLGRPDSPPCTAGVSHARHRFLEVCLEWKCWSWRSFLLTPALLLTLWSWNSNLAGIWDKHGQRDCEMTTQLFKEATS